MKALLHAPRASRPRCLLVPRNSPRVALFWNPDGKGHLFARPVVEGRKPAA
jgi:hypothetical protein